MPPSTPYYEGAHCTGLYATLENLKVSICIMLLLGYEKLLARLDWVSILTLAEL